MERVYIKTFGCQMNEYDTLRMQKLLEAKGYQSVSSYDKASIILFNTCSVRHKAEFKVYSELGRLKKLKTTRADLIIGVGGCVAQQEGKSLLNKFYILDLVFGTHVLTQLPDFLVKIRKTGQRIVSVDMGKS
jgi:tRNA-2-methylthio-N6-dimethylallyladenosine synthase